MTSRKFPGILALGLALFALPSQAQFRLPWSRSAPADSATRSDSIPVFVEHERTEFDFHRVRSERLARQLWTASGASGPFHPGNYQVLVTDPDAATRRNYLLREGTQVAELPDSVMARHGRAIRAGGSGAILTEKRGPTKALWNNIWDPEDPLRPYRWPSGVSASGGWAISAAPSSSVSYMREYRGDIAVTPFGIFLAEFGWRNTRHGGGVRENLLYQPWDTTWSNLGPSENGWRFAVGIPGVKYEIFHDDRMIPEFYWLDPKAGEASYKTGQPGTILSDSMSDGKVLRRWREDGEVGGLSGNITQAVHVRAGMIRYSAWFDGDLYRSVIQRVMFEELPAPFGEWGFGLTFADDAAHSRLYADFFPAALRIGPRSWDSNLRFFFLRLDLDLRSTDTFRAGLSSRLTFDTPFLRPGDRR